MVAGRQFSPVEALRWGGGGEEALVGPGAPRNLIIWPPSGSTWICLVTLVPFVGPSGSLLGVCGPVGLAFCPGTASG